MTLKRVNDGAHDPRKARVVRPFRLLAFDPGGTTGWASVDYSDPTSQNKPPTQLDQLNFDAGQIGPHEHHKELHTFLHTQYIRTIISEKINFYIVYEDFQFRQHASKDKTKTKVELISCEYIGIIKLFVQQFAVPLKVYSASAAKGILPDKGPQANVKLQQLGLYRPGNPHSNDATRHLLRHLVFGMKIQDPILPHWL
jgi:hypothetical protein